MFFVFVKNNTGYLFILYFTCMTNYLEAYKQYYLLRMKQREGNTDYSNTYAAEKQLFEIINSCATLEAFKDKIGNANEQVAMALVTDEQNIRLRHYEEIKETVKAACCRRILEKVKLCNNVSELISMVNEEQNLSNIEITTDTISPFADVLFLENLEIWEKAEIPAAYKEKYAAYANEESANIKNAYAAIEKEMNNWQPGWKFNFEKIDEERHRRLLPYSNEIVAAQIKLTQQILNK
jgi:hypothetical protein